MTNPKRPRDPNQLAKLIADIATGEVTETLGRVDAGRLMGFAGDVAVFEERSADSPPTVSGYRVGS